MSDVVQTAVRAWVAPGRAGEDQTDFRKGSVNPHGHAVLLTGHMVLSADPAYHSALFGGTTCTVRGAVLEIPLIPKYAVVMVLTAVKALVRIATESLASCVHQIPRTAAAMIVKSPASTATHPVTDRVFSTSSLNTLDEAGEDIITPRVWQIRPESSRELIATRSHIE
ncbi:MULTISPECIES: hypothetical protein [unclassified Streptomyces]|uniref:hypothetical protein n=1 Tax=unclassified Streptomyces TaxID=2593676 RepID=UPI00404387E5